MLYIKNNLDAVVGPDDKCGVCGTEYGGTKHYHVQGADDPDAVEQSVFDAAEVQPTPVHNDGPRIVDLVVDDLKARAEVGHKRYGTYLQPNNGRDALLDAYQEILDLAKYIRQELYERRGQ
jgi:hypothetical protein